MLKTRILTAVLLLAVLLPILLLNSFPAFAAAAILLFGAAVWECLRLFGNRWPRVNAVVPTALFAYLVLGGGADPQFASALSMLCAALWLLRFAPSLAIGLPARAGFGNRVLETMFLIALFGCFIAIVTLFQRSPRYLLSVMALVWIADIGAYFAGKAFGRRKLAPSISPGKSWEGAFGGGLAVLGLSAASIAAAPSAPWLQDTFAVQLQARLGWPAALAALAFIVAASVVGDLFESQLKRRAGVKDSSALLPGHGGVLDRIDALIPVLPIAALIGAQL